MCLTPTSRISEQLDLERPVWFADQEHRSPSKRPVSSLRLGTGPGPDAFAIATLLACMAINLIVAAFLTRAFEL